MSFNHYAKIKRILHSEPEGWYIRRIDESTSAKNFRGELVNYNYYYRIFTANGKQIKYCKFQKIDKLASVLNVSVEELPIVG